MQGNQARGNASQGNAPPQTPQAFDFRSDTKILIRVDEKSDLAIDIGTETDFRSDSRFFITNPVDFISDIELVISQALFEDIDILILVANPENIEEDGDLSISVINPEDIEEDGDLLLDIGEPVDYNADTELTVVERVDFKSDMELIIREAVQFFSDIKIHVRTDKDNPGVVNIATIIERRFLPYLPNFVMFAPGTETERYKLMWSYASVEYNARLNYQAMLESLRLMNAKGAALDWVADRVGEKRWQFYDDRVDRFEADEAMRARLIPYWRERRGTLEALEAAVLPLHDSYGGYSSFFSYTIGQGWVLGRTGKTESGSTTYLGGPLESLVPLFHLRAKDIWIMGETGHSELGSTTYLGDRERFGPFTFVIDVWNYPEIDEWQELYLHTIRRFKTAGTVAIVVFRRGDVMLHEVLAGDGTTTYTLSGYNLQGKTTILTIEGLGQNPDAAYTLTNSGSDTIIEFNATDPGAPPIGAEIVVYWLDEG